MPYSHLQGIGCFKCAAFFRANLRRSSADKFIEQAIKVHGERYDYSKVIYKGTHIKVVILCSIHGAFNMLPKSHVSSKQGCRTCALDRASIKQTKTRQQFIDAANKIHNFKYNYTQVVYEKSWIKVIILCPKHGEFLQKPNTHLTRSGCPTCKSSRGELAVEAFLQKHGYPYTRQKKFAGCRNPKTGRQLPYDFYLPDQNILIEYDGIQHVRNSFGTDKAKAAEELVNIRYRDQVKTEFAAANGIKLLRIPHTCEDISGILELFIPPSR